MVTSIVIATAFKFWIYILMFSHWVGDFVCQTRWMADNKGKRWDALAIHVLVYTLVVTFVGILLPLSPVLFLFSGSTAELMTTLGAILQLMGVFAVITYMLHFATDAVTSRISKHYWNKHKIHHFFATIGLDQFIHFVCLIETLQFALRVF